MPNSPPSSTCPKLQGELWRGRRTSKFISTANNLRLLWTGPQRCSDAKFNHKQCAKCLASSNSNSLSELGPSLTATCRLEQAAVRLMRDISDGQGLRLTTTCQSLPRTGLLGSGKRVLSVSFLGSSLRNCPARDVCVSTRRIGARTTTAFCGCGPLHPC